MCKLLPALRDDSSGSPNFEVPISWMRGLRLRKEKSLAPHQTAAGKASPASPPRRPRASAARAGTHHFFSRRPVPSLTCPSSAADGRPPGHDVGRAAAAFPNGKEQTRCRLRPPVKRG